MRAPLRHIRQMIIKRKLTCGKETLLIRSDIESADSNVAFRLLCRQPLGWQTGRKCLRKDRNIEP